MNFFRFVLNLNRGLLLHILNLLCMFLVLIWQGLIQ